MKKSKGPRYTFVQFRCSVREGTLSRKQLGLAASRSSTGSVVVGTMSVFRFDDIRLGQIIAMAMVINLTVATMAGTLIPVLLKKFKIDPALSGGVLLTTITDVVGFVAFLGLATAFYL